MAIYMSSEFTGPNFSLWLSDSDSGLVVNRNQLLYLFCLESAGTWTKLSLSCSSAGYQQNNSHVACFGYIYWIDSAENTTHYFLILSSYIRYPYNSAVGH